MPDFHWCISSSCKSGQIHEVSLDGPVFRCHACGLRSCVAHNVPWHSGESCEEYTYRTRPKHQRKEDRASEKLVGRIAKICPGPNCGVKIQKTAGCDHMTCRQCTHEFCWICLASYTDIRRNGNGAHQPSCRYHSVDFEV
ncbi:hypothetical protein BT63DRAFT_438699 [Microthyrium microscopicum]|uniref:RBR-type E3 ubiquitin transferase n=1 Tax=Microthyrium microscopicum TaxID=703497 RepID=A0A6A6UJZ1_9PEZI|nr:hypothetical protein BT63DRAFT_438699 [Microthyrium microscopicum]